MADELDEWRQDQQYLRAESEDERRQMLRADAPSFTEDDDEDDEYPPDDTYDSQSSGITEDDDTEELAPVERDKSLPPEPGSVESKLNENMRSLAKAVGNLAPKKRTKTKRKPKPARSVRPKKAKSVKKGGVNKVTGKR